MRNWMRWMAPVMGLALLIGFANQSRAADVPGGKAKVTVTVVDANGKAVAGAHVGLFVPMRRTKTEAGPTDPGQKRVRPTPLVEGVTDSDGKVSFDNIADGRYGVFARVKGVGHGMARLAVTGTTDVAVTVTIQPRQGGANKTPPPPTDDK